jgi:hypothetical protein
MVVDLFLILNVFLIRPTFPHSSLIFGLLT